MAEIKNPVADTGKAYFEIVRLTSGARERDVWIAGSCVNPGQAVPVVLYAERADWSREPAGRSVLPAAIEHTYARVARALSGPQSNYHPVMVRAAGAGRFDLLNWEQTANGVELRVTPLRGLHKEMQRSWRAMEFCFGADAQALAAITIGHLGVDIRGTRPQSSSKSAA